MQYVLLALVLSSCLTPAKVSSKLASAWHGSTYEELQSSWGEPDAELPNGKYKLNAVYLRPGLPAGQNLKDLAVAPYASLPQTICRVTFTLENDVIVGQLWEGDKRICLNEIRDHRKWSE